MLVRRTAISFPQTHRLDSDKTYVYDLWIAFNPLSPTSIYQNPSFTLNMDVIHIFFFRITNYLKMKIYSLLIIAKLWWMCSIYVEFRFPLGEVRFFDESTDTDSQQHHNLLSGSDSMQVQQVYFSVLACYDLIIGTKH